MQEPCPEVKSAAARARRLSEDAHIVLFERGPDVSFANCGLPYYLGGAMDQDEEVTITKICGNVVTISAPVMGRWAPNGPSCAVSP